MFCGTNFIQNLYQAVLREHATNAVDAHVEADIEDCPIEVTLPNPMSLELKIRDFGPALTDKEIQDIYAFYGYTSAHQQANRYARYWFQERVCLRW